MTPLAKIMGFETLVLGILFLTTFLIGQSVIAVALGMGLLVAAGTLKLRKKV